MKKVKTGGQLTIDQEEEKEKCPYPYATLLKNPLNLFLPLSHFYKNARFSLLFLQRFKEFNTAGYPLDGWRKDDYAYYKNLCSAI